MSYYETIISKDEGVIIRKDGVSVPRTYSKGEWVAVKGKVINTSPGKDDGQILTIQRQTIHGDHVNYDVRSDQVQARIAAPCPPAPPNSTMLRDRNQDLWSQGDNGYWQRLVRSDTYPGEVRPSGVRSSSYIWGAEFLDTFGPFDVFESSQTIFPA